MRRVAIAVGVVAISAAGAAWADDSGHAGEQSLKSQQMLHDGTLGTTTENHTGGDAMTTPRSGQAYVPPAKGTEMKKQ